MRARRVGGHAGADLRHGPGKGHADRSGVVVAAPRHHDEDGELRAGGLAWEVNEVRRRWCPPVVVDDEAASVETDSLLATANDATATSRATAAASAASAYSAAAASAAGAEEWQKPQSLIVAGLCAQPRDHEHENRNSRDSMRASHGATHARHRQFQTSGGLGRT